jgi:hypothetical protein
MSQARLEQARAAALAELNRTPQARPWWVDALALAVLDLGIGVGLLLAVPSHHEQHASDLFRALGALGLAVVATAGAVAAVRPGSRWLRLGVLGVAGGSMVAMAAAASSASGAPALGGAGCSIFEVLSAVVPLAVSMWVLARFASDPLRAVVAGLAASAGGLLALHFTCPVGTLTHLTGFHLAPWLLISLLSLGIRRLVRSATFAP